MEEETDSISADSFDEMMNSIINSLEGLSKNIFKKLKTFKIRESCSSCSICLDKYSINDVVKVLPCNHKFHNKCLKPWFKDSVCCPNCRLDIKEYYSDPNEKSVMLPVDDENPLNMSFIGSNILNRERSIGMTR